MLKIDKKIVKEFLGVDEPFEIISPLKTARLYYTNACTLDDAVLVLTPTAAESNWLKGVISGIEQTDLLVEPTEHKRGKNYVYTFKTSKKND